MFDVEQEGKKRYELHKNQQSHRPLTPNGQDEDVVGLAGEKQFEAEFGYKLDATLRADGDGGSDFETPLGTLDVKTARIPNNLPLEVGKPVASIYVLAKFFDETKTAELIGWTFGSDLTKCPQKKLLRPDHPKFSRAPVNYCMPREQLKSMWTLRTALYNAALKERAYHKMPHGEHRHICPECRTHWGCLRVSDYCPIKEESLCIQCLAILSSICCWVYKKEKAHA